jgi:aminopeptidase
MTLSDPRFDRWAKVQITYSLAVQPGEKVAILGGQEAAPLLRALARETLKAGGHPVMLPSLDGTSLDLLQYGSDEQLAFISPVERFVREEADCVVTINAESNSRSMTALDPSRQQLHRAARGELGATFMRRASEGKVRWSLSAYPTDSAAQDAGMSTDDYAAFLFSACKLDREDPAAAWQELNAEQQRLIDWLAPRSEIHVLGPDTDLSLSVGGRVWINSDGKRNFPSGEVFTGPVEDSANGYVRFSYPVITAGRQIEDIRLRFERGLVVEATAARNEEYLRTMLDSDEGARRLGEFAFGTNFDITRFTGSILLDEKIGGTVHMALGAGYPDTLSTNRSSIHWDMICDLRNVGLVTVDGAQFLENGRFLV